MKDDELLIAALEDKIAQCAQHSMLTHSTFLDLRQRGLALQIMRSKKCLNYALYGGYSEAERVIMLFLPDYMPLPPLDQDLAQLLQDYDNQPLCLLRITASGSQQLSHRDYLGALTGLGIKREMVGDILVNPQGCDILVMCSIAEFLLYNFAKAGRANLRAEILPLEQLLLPNPQIIEKQDTIASLRLDNVLAAAFAIPRSQAVEQIAAGKVFLNNLPCQKPDAQVNAADKLVLRGQGKAVLKSVDYTTRKNRIAITLQRYI